MYITLHVDWSTGMCLPLLSKFDVSLMVLYSFLETSKSVIGDAKTNMRASFPYPASLPLLSKFWGLVHGTLWLSEHLQDYNRRCQDYCTLFLVLLYLPLLWKSWGVVHGTLWLSFLCAGFGIPVLLKKGINMLCFHFIVETIFFSWCIFVTAIQLVRSVVVAH